MDIERQTRRTRDVRDMPIRKPSDPLPSIFESARHSGFTTTNRSVGRNNNAERPREQRSAARPRSQN